MPQTIGETDVERFFPEVAWIADPDLRHSVTEIWIEVAAQMPWNDLRDVPKNVKEEAGRGLIEHVRGVTQMACEICEVAKRIQGRAYDRDLLLAACLLHDVSKPLETEPDPEKTATGHPQPGRKSRLGRNIQHGVYGAHKALAKNLSLELANLIITHTHSSGIRGTTWEAAALFYADFADSDAAISAVGGKLFLQKWRI